MKASNNDEAAIQKLTERFIAAFNSGDIDEMMKAYIPNETFVIFDIVPRDEYRGADTYRNYWIDMLSHFSESPKIEINNLTITVDDSVGFGYSFQRVTGTDKQGNSVDRTVRVTNGYCKIEGNWLIALEHVSVPVNLKTGKADFTSRYNT